jgi:hypothetical protein
VIVVGFALAWTSYTAMFWGYSLVKGYNLTLGQIVSPKAYTGTWPPPAAGAVTASSSSSGTSATSPSTATQVGADVGSDTTGGSTIGTGVGAGVGQGLSDLGLGF